MDPSPADLTLHDAAAGRNRASSRQPFIRIWERTIADRLLGMLLFTRLAHSMKPIASATISSDHIEGRGNVAYSYGTAIWQSGRSPDAASTTRVRQVLVWRREADGVWRIALEAFLPLEAAK
jgi:hypothetical protein